MMKNCKKTLLDRGRKLVSLLLCALTATACTDTLDEAALPKPLSVDVNTRDITDRAPIHGTALPDASSIGISLLAEDGTPYDGVTYANLKYTASGTAPDQAWSTPDIPTLSSTPAKLVAYYPWADGTDYNAVPVETSTQTDYMYSKWLTGLSNANPNASIVMQHALTAVRVALVKGDFTADVDVSSVSVKSPAFATAGSLDATTGALSGLTGTGEAVTVTADFPLTAQATNVEVMAVPDVSVAAGVTTVTTQIGDRKYSVNINFTESYKQGYIYTYTLTLNNTGMEVTSVAVTPWQEGTQDTGDLGVDNDYIVKIEVPENGYTFTHNMYNFIGTIDWGDGTTEDVASLSSYPTHTYTTAGEYTVTVKGRADYLYNLNEETIYTELVHIGVGVGLKEMTRAFYCSNLNKIHPGALDGCTEVTTFIAAFLYTKITEIPEGLFDKCTKVKYWGYPCTDGVFAFCEGLISIPEGLFKNNKESLDFSACFMGCTGLKNIPAGLFDNCTEVTTFYYAFNGCTGITSIPEGLFDDNIKVTDFLGTFNACYGLTSIPAGLFKNCTEVTSFSTTFQDCAGLTSIPEGLFDNNTKVTNFGSTFWGTYITEIPAGLFDSFTEVTDFGYTFAFCEALTSIPEGLFDKCVKVESFGSTFQDCTGLASIPEGLFDKCTEVTNFRGTFANCEGLTSIPTGLFDYNTKVTQFAGTYINGTFSGCTALTGESPYTIINVNGEDKKVHLYERSQYPEYFTAPEYYGKTYYKCTGLTDYANIPSGWK